MPSGRLFVTPYAMVQQPYPVTTYQPVYFCGDNMRDVKDKISEYCEGMRRTIQPVYDPTTRTVWRLSYSMPLV